MKVGGSSLEVALTPVMGERDILTGTSYIEELRSSEYAYKDRNNFRVAEEDSQQLTIVPIFPSHTHPRYLREHYSDAIPIEKYFSFSIVRNPWDVCVSYFWWTFNSYTRLDGKPLKKKVINESIQPMPYDSVPVLKVKFQNWCESHFNWSEASGEGIFGKVVEGDNVLSAFARIQEEFFVSESIDHFLKFENLQYDFDEVCKKLEIQPGRLLRLKSKIRKAKTSYRDYYNDYTKDLVLDKFQRTVTRFNYKF